MALAGHTGDASTAISALTSDDGSVRATALQALERIGRLDDPTIERSLADPDPQVRRRAVALAATRPAIGLLGALDDRDELVVETACWAFGEREQVDDATLDRLIGLAGAHRDPLVREAAVAALGAIGDERGLPAILVGTTDKPAVRRRAVIALAPFDGPDVDAALTRALSDRDWQVREAAEELQRAGDAETDDWDEVPTDPG